MASAEMVAKANEKRINALEKKLDAFEKDFRKSGDMSGLIKRVNTLETAVKAVTVMSKSSGSSDTKVYSELSNLKDLVIKREEKIKILEKTNDPNAGKKIANLEKRKDVLEKTITALAGRTQRDQKEMVDKLNKQAKKLGEAAHLESRLKVLEALVKSALSK